MHNLKFFDFEVFPEWWCVVVSDEREKYKSEMYHCRTDLEEELDIKKDMRVYSSDGYGATNDAFCQELLAGKPLVSFKAEMSQGVLSGYNNKRYDNIILKCVMLNFTPRQVYMASELLIDPSLATKSVEYGRIANYIRFGWDGMEASQDFMDDSFKGLKDKEASYGLDIRETTVPFGKCNLTHHEKDEIIFYCKHDVYALHVHYSSVARAYVDTKIQLCEIFDLPKKVGYNSTNAVLSGKVLGAVRVHGTTIKDPTIVIRDKGLDAYFKKYIPREVYSHLLTSQTAKKFIIYDNEVSVADGGLHSEILLPKLGKIKPAIYVESTDDYCMFNIDASSCYTSVMIYCDAISRGIKNPKRLAEIYNRRMRLKATPKSEWSKDDKYFTAAAKLVLNTTYGAMGNKYLPLYDEYMRTKTCRIGQMILIALANSLFQNVTGCRVIQNNTDGVLIYARRDQLSLIQSLVDEFSEISRFIFEVEEDKLLWQLNVNNYVAIDPKDNMKDKGGSFVHDIHQPGYYHIRPLSNYCIPKAQIAFYRGQTTNPVKTMIENTKVSDFCLTCTKGPGYYGMFHLNPDGDVILGKVARVIAVMDQTLGIVKKRKWVEVKPTKAQLAKGLTTADLIALYKKEGRPIEVRDGVWKVHQEDTCALCPPNALIVNDALYNYRIENRELIHADGRRWKIDYAYYCRELDKALDVPWYQLKGIELKSTRRFNL